MSDIYSKYETVIGLEVHAQLLTESKLFCSDSAAFGGAPNTHISAITMGHPGTLPRMNRKAAEYAIKLGLACHCDIEKDNYFARKNYFYPDLPKGYQISQHTAPICKNGYLTISTDAGTRTVKLNRIHLEEDAGKLLHDQDPQYSYVDLNRAGVPLVEIVSEPDLHSGDEAYAYLTEMRRLVRYLEVCDGNMEEGSMRCDANISVRLKGSTTLGTKVEVKNMNSIRSVKKAIEVEVKRQIDIIESGGTIIQETRSFDAATGSSFSMRSKEEANDYRYFPEPDLAPFHLSDEFIAQIKASLPALPEELIERYTMQYGLTEYDARVICDDKATAAYFEEVIKATSHYKAASNWVSGPVKSWLNEQGKDISQFPVSPALLAALIELVDAGKVSFSIASSRILPAMIAEPGDPLGIATRLNLLQDNNADNITPIIDEVLAKYPDKVAAFKGGKKGLMSLFVGEVMKLSKGKADPRLTNELLAERLKS
ncbi:aspartyl/glutamyl-tRNA(Asn/Gln) amidotransferase subunit B [Chitinophaga terrae (ex Kim and Jung 2007)]|uniref:Aspartyl/glutamyl-tRNA(Asn/Gln) amidotransferase subunit B n=1 Tax=Chitinophaga terrae (ex Kim and Jung 2007) TaxID=408074 RepID=A0A1H4F8P2_9BACT|nr:Asp-tRNA(Asn)/Glu-tRNA(Gln) amidotransferase subunit GatB [Chitinophaga terrae (ex Kim and Jung 2007)]GEP92308.1 aspartyl/glutamyl-tRNA(Asn/Gln) amidotransferase subunit B [Chitinophaga terrae (ex Kim and Jung 2007)]SEA93683.1 aspartyl/glutamyl-tRNA(Asn/Gln) amidotransferase subunit B [Chitinophaga terrae (ex Kim and Jung 2007)]